MACEHWQAAISAIADGEDPGVEPRLLDAHLAACPSCRAFRGFTDVNLGPARVQVAEAMPDLSRRLVKLNAIADRASRWSVVRVTLAVVALEIIVFSLRPLILGKETDASVHAARHLGAFTVAYGVGLLLVVARPARARTMLPVAGVLAVALAITAFTDIVNGEVPLLNETSHLPELLSVVLVWLLAVPSSRRRDHSADKHAPGLRAVPGDEQSGSRRASGG